LGQAEGLVDRQEAPHRHRSYHHRQKDKAKTREVLLLWRRPHTYQDRMSAAMRLTRAPVAIVMIVLCLSQAQIFKGPGLCAAASRAERHVFPKPAVRLSALEKFERLLSANSGHFPKRKETPRLGFLFNPDTWPGFFRRLTKLLLAKPMPRSAQVPLSFLAHTIMTFRIYPHRVFDARSCQLLRIEANHL
jgi:hypothetical protein